jgi:hypothetical protein
MTDPSRSPDGKRPVFDRASGSGATRVSTIQVLDLTTGHVSMLPASEGFFSPRWSPDGRLIVALSRDCTRLVIFDVVSQTWSDLAWARVRVADHAVETVASARSLQLATGVLGIPWFGTTPDDSPVALLDAGTHDIYALDWEAS